MKAELLPVGKLSPKILSELLEKYSRADRRILVGPYIGEDAAAVDMGEKALVMTTDPITFATDEIGHYSVMVNANDIATTGADPMWFTATILLPEAEGNREMAEEIFRQIHAACEKLGVFLVGGHTEITFGLARPIVVGQMIGEVMKKGLIRTGGAMPGDAILMSKGLCVEGTAIMAREKGDDLLKAGTSAEIVDRAKGFLYDPGISIVEEARLACRVAQVHAMHDITEGGLANGLMEIAVAAGVQIEVDEDRIPLYEESRVLCEALGLNPMGVIGSGSLLIASEPSEAEKILAAGIEQGLAIARIGRVKRAGAPAVSLITREGQTPLSPFARDEILKIF
ncbi:MAG: hydrogenase expression/formation protein [Deltaproteobacteria bacterium]|nr:MAG: hydrogenase expression/formation protein [Deltaproteobacteria bacterium]